MTLSKRILLFFGGLAIFSYGITLSIQVQHLGIHPWDVLNIALFQKFGLTIGTWSILSGLVFVTITLFLNRKYVNIGTMLNALTIGPMVDLFLFVDVFPPSFNIVTDVLILVLGIVCMGVGGGMYVASELGAGPRDGFMLSVSEKLKMSISKIRIIIESSVLVIGYLLGGPVFIFTFIYTFIQSPIFQRSYLYFLKLQHQHTSTDVHSQI